jgi:hypothetical protein
MKPSKQVTELRKGGQLDEAFKLSVELVSSPGANEWEIAAYGWCLIDLLKRHVSDQDAKNFREYLELLTKLEVPSGNELLAEHRQRALNLADADRQSVLAAKQFGKNGLHEEAVQAFMVLMAKGVLTREDKLAFGWELYKAAARILKEAKERELTTTEIDRAKKFLGTYLKLDISEMGLLHSCVLQLAIRLAQRDYLKLDVFVRMWNLELFRKEDFESSRSDDGKVFPPLAETALQRASKVAVNGQSLLEMNYILPHLERGVKRFPENVWLKFNLAKTLRGVGRLDDARKHAIEFARSKAMEYWTWELLGDLESDAAVRMSCYAKALTCSEDDTFVGKVRVKFADSISAEFPGQARYEIERVIEHKRREGVRVPEDAQKAAQSAWFLSSTSIESGLSFYSRFKLRAEELLFSHVPWSDGVVGDEFRIQGHDGKKDRHLRRIFVRANPIPIEIGVATGRPDMNRLTEGARIKVQMESSAAEPWKTIVHRIQLREGIGDDVFREECGVIDSINTDKSLVHIVVAKGIDGTFPLAKFVGSAAIGQGVAVRLARFHDKNGPRTRILSASSSSRVPGADVLKPFDDEIEVSNGLGFTPGGIFIPPDVVAAAKVDCGDRVEGFAVVNFDKRKGVWGWKAISARRL